MFNIRLDAIKNIFTKIGSNASPYKHVTKPMQELTSDVVQLSKPYSDITSDMLKQRKQIQWRLFEGYGAEQKFAHVKGCYIEENRPIRHAIISNSTMSQQDIDDLEMLDQLINQNQIPRNVTLYRGASAYDFGYMGMTSPELLSQICKKGKTFQIPIYPSTSLEYNVGKEFATNTSGRILFKINAPKGTNGIYMEKLPLNTFTTDLQNEEEILLPRNLTYKFKTLTYDNGLPIVELDIVKNHSKKWGIFKS